MFGDNSETDPRYPGFRRRTTWILRRYPITALVVAPYAALVIPSALLYGNPDAGFLVWLVLIAAAPVAIMESLLPLLPFGHTKLQDTQPSSADPRYVKAFMVARVVTVVSIAADVSAASFGRGTIITQVASEIVSSPLASLAAMVSGWKYLAIALLLYSVMAGHAQVGSLYRWAAALVAGQLFVFSMTALTAQLAAYLVFVASAGAISGVVRAKYVIIAIAVFLLAWPGLFALRNELREASGIRVAIDMTASDRLRVDLQMARLRSYDVPADVGQPGLADLVKYGLVPRVFDPERPAISTGVKINMYLGGSERSAYTFLAIGNVYFLEGVAGVVIFYSAWAASATLLMRGRRRSSGPVGVCLLCFVIAGPLSWSGTYPDVVIGTVQHVVSAMPVFFVLWATKVRRRGETLSGNAVSSAPSAALAR